MDFMRKTIVILLLELATCLAMAQPYSYVRNFTIRDGLAANTISGIEQSPNGLIWIATWNGLCCYDGYRFTTFRSDNGAEADALSTNRISMIKADSRENVWVRTYDGGLYLLDTRQCRFVNVGLLLGQKYGKTIHPRNFYAMPTGHVWITDELGALNLRIDDRYPTDVERMEIVDLHQHPEMGRHIRKVEVDGNQREWIITDKGRVLYGQWDKVLPMADEADVEQPDTALTWRLEACGISPANVNKCLVDRQGNLWLTSAHGLILVNFLDRSMQWLPLVEGQETRSVVCRRDGTVWAGSKDGYIGVFTSKGEQLGWLTPQGQLSTTRTRFADHIYVMKEDSQGRTWIGTKGQGLYIAGSQRVISHYVPDAANPYALSHAGVYDIDEDGQGNIWIGTYGGGLNLASCQPDGTLRFLHSGNELKNYPMKSFSRIRRITHDSQGGILLSCTEGLVTFSNRDRKFYCSQHRQQDSTSLRTSDVMQTLVTRDGRIYVATLGGGVQQLTSENLLQDSLPFRLLPVLNRGMGNVMSMTEDGQGNVWIVYETEVCRYSPATGRMERFNPNHLTNHIELTEGLSAIDRQGQLWIAAAGGLFVLDTQQMQKSLFRPHITFTNVLFQGEQTTHPVLNQQTLTVNKDQRNLTISFAALDYGDNYLMEYAYRMDGEEEWNYIGSMPRISFSQLPPGLHTLEVKSTNGDGVWMDNVATLQLDVTPMLWERGWVRLLCLLLVIGLSTWAVMAWLRHRQHMQEREQRLENIMRQYRELQESVGTIENGELRTERCDFYHLEEPKIVNEDDEMMNRLMKFIETRISDDELKIEEMAEAVGLSRSVFFVKIKSLVGMAPIDFLRHLRMERAKQLVELSTMNVSQIAYAVGFTDPKYFTRCFKKEMGCTPTELRERQANQKESE